MIFLGRTGVLTGNQLLELGLHQHVLSNKERSCFKFTLTVHLIPAPNFRQTAVPCRPEKKPISYCRRANTELQSDLLGLAKSPFVNFSTTEKK